MRGTRILVAVLGVLVIVSPAWADEGLWLYSHPPRRQLKEKYAFELTEAFLERLQKASVMVGHGGSGAFVSSDGLVLTNRHVALRWLHELSEKGPDVARAGYYGDERDKELRCAGLELRVLLSIQDVSERVLAAIKSDMSLAAAAQARHVVLYAIEEESRTATGLVSEVVTLDHGARYHLYRYKKYTDVRLVFAPEGSIGSLLDICFLRAYEDGKPAKTIRHLTWSPTTPENGDLIMVSGRPGSSDRFRTSAELEALYGPLTFFDAKLVSRLKNAVSEFAHGHPYCDWRTSYAAFGLDIRSGRIEGTMHTQEKLLHRIRLQEQARQAGLLKEDPETAERCQQARDRIARCFQEGRELRQAHYFLESANAFHSTLFHFARCLLRRAEESRKADAQRLPEYRDSARVDLKRYLLSRWPVVKELEIAKLAESLDVWARYAGADSELVAKVLDGKTPQQRARALIEGTKLDDPEVRKALLEGDGNVVLDSQDSMLRLARLVDPRSRRLRSAREERLDEPCRQAYAVLARVREETDCDAWYPDATGTVRLSFGKVLAYAKSKPAVRFTDALAFIEHKNLPPKWIHASGDVDAKALILFRCTADVLPGNSGSPVVDREGRLVGVAAWVPSAAPQLSYCNDDWGCGAVAAQGILELLDKVYHAAELVKELGGSKNTPQRIVIPLPPPSILVFQPSVPQPVANPSLADAPRSSAAPAATTGPTTPMYTPVTPGASSDSSPAHHDSGLSRPATKFSVSPVPTADALLRPQPTVPPGITPTRTPRSVEIHKQKLPALIKALTDSDAEVRQAAESGRSVAIHKELVPALIKALTDSDAEVRQAAETALASLGADAVPALVAALRVKKGGWQGSTEAASGAVKSGAAPVTGNAATGDRNAILLLVQALEDDDVEVRRRAARSLPAVVRDYRPTDAPRP